MPESRLQSIFDYDGAAVAQAAAAAQAGQAAGSIEYTGSGLGLPLVRTYATYFGGQCSLQSVQNHSTEASIYLGEWGSVWGTVLLFFSWYSFCICRCF